jgi:putative tricarboxylic transport membrane protein
LLTQLRKSAPYLVVLAVAGYLFFLASRIEFVAPGGRIGPAAWPRAILLLAMATCAYEIVKTWFFGRKRRDLAGVLQSLVEAAPANAALAPEQDERTYPHLLWIGIALTVLYVVLIETLGFFLCTFVYLAAFMFAGRYRRPGVVLATSLAGSLVFMFVFMKIVYVSLPLGQGAFAEITFFLMRLMGIR